MRAAVERLAAVFLGGLVRRADLQQHLAVKRAFAHRVVAVVGAVNRVVRPHVNAMRPLECTLAPGLYEIAFAVEHDHGMRTAIEDVDVVLSIATDRRHITECPTRGQIAPAFFDAKGEVAAADDDAGHGGASGLGNSIEEPRL